MVHLIMSMANKKMPSQFLMYVQTLHAQHHQRAPLAQDRSGPIIQKLMLLHHLIDTGIAQALLNHAELGDCGF